MEQVAKWKSASCILMPPSCTPPDGWLQSRCWQHQLCSLRACSACVATWSGEPGLSECFVKSFVKKFVQKMLRNKLSEVEKDSTERARERSSKTRLVCTEFRSKRHFCSKWLILLHGLHEALRKGGQLRRLPKGAVSMFWCQLTHSFSFVASSNWTSSWNCWNPWKLWNRKTLFIFKKSVWSCCPLKRARLKVPNDWWRPQSHQVPPGDPINNSKCTEIRKPDIHQLNYTYIV